MSAANGVASLAARVIDAWQARSGRYLLGIAGPPAAGKSTLAERLRDEINNKLGEDIAQIAPMDGFHLTNDELDRAGLRSVKGAPHTFDAEGYVDRLKLLRDVPEVGWPVYDRQVVHEPVPDAILIGPQTGIVITEGNYLLLDDQPWSQVRSLLNQVWYLDAPVSLVERRLLDRHRAIGRSAEEATAKIAGTDLPNAELIAATRRNADLVLDQVKF
ncbi:nucleoside/nucleotide kinase family protein [Longispora sp. NPDC051575]|uniref:nucleoside/nucleotide kinase family protein n=1 Tax=Longispora sp. NPDC051575 TaxID=3154943 RepID=UPI0034293D23